MEFKSTFISCLLAISVTISAQNWRDIATSPNASKANFVKSMNAPNSKVTAQKLQIPEKDISKWAKNSHLLKASKLAQVAPKALFQRPEGTYLPSFIGAEDIKSLGYNYSFTGIMGSAFSKPWVFTNKSTGASSYSWSWGANTNFSTSVDLTLKDDTDNFLYPGDFYSPSLKAINGSESTLYKLPTSANFPDAFLLSSSDALYVGNMDLFGNSSTLSNGVSLGFFSAQGGVGLSGSGTGYFWGSCLRNQDGVNGTVVSSIVSVYEKPMSPLTIKDICYFGNSTAAIPVPASKKLQATIVKINDKGELTTDTIASATIFGSDVLKDDDGIYFPFVFKEIDKEMGLESVVYPVVSDEFAIILSGIDQEGMNFGLYSDVDNTLESTSFFSKKDAVTGDNIEGLYQSSSTGMNIALTMNAFFNYLYTDPIERTLIAPVAGGAAMDVSNKQSGALVYSFFYDVKDSVTKEDLIWLKNDLPDWVSLSYSDQYYKQYGGLFFQFTATALPKGIKGRKVDVPILSYGAETIITVTQGDVTSVDNAYVTTVRAFKTNQGYSLAYTSDYNELVVSALTGQQVASYHLPAGGTFQLANSSLTKGIYLLQFKGLKTKTIKIIH